MNTMYIGSGDVTALMSKKDSQSHLSLLRRFVSGVKPYYNARASPIDALRTGVILEDRYLLTLPDNYFAQYVCVSVEMDVFKCSLDFARIENGLVADFDELKSVYLSDYLEFEQYKDDPDALLAYTKRSINITTTRFRNNCSVPVWMNVILFFSLLRLMTIKKT